MADYREISQQYAKEGIRTGLILNAGAALALLSQAGDLIDHKMASEARAAMLLWSAGTVSAAVIWILAFLSTRYVDKYEQEGNAKHLRTSDKFMLAGLILVVLSLVCFATGCLRLATGFASLD